MELVEIIKLKAEFKKVKEDKYKSPLIWIYNYPDENELNYEIAVPSYSEDIVKRLISDDYVHGYKSVPWIIEGELPDIKVLVLGPFNDGYAKIMSLKDIVKYYSTVDDQVFEVYEI